MRILKKFEEQGGELKVFWFYEEEDIDKYEEAIDFMDSSGLKLELKHFDPPNHLLT